MHDCKLLARVHGQKQEGGAAGELKFLEVLQGFRVPIVTNALLAGFQLPLNS